LRRRFVGISLIFLFLLISKDLYSISPGQDGYILLVGMGIGKHTSGIVSEERKFVENGQFYLIAYNSEIDRLDSVAVSYDYYKTYNPHISLMYSTSDHISVGIFYQYKMVDQQLNPPVGYTPPSSKRIITLNQLGPVFNFWKPLELIALSLTVCPTYNFGKLIRIPNIYENIENYHNPLDQILMTKFHESISISGIGISTVLGINYFISNGVFTKIGVRYDFSHIGIKDNFFKYSSSTNFNDFYLEFGIGFSTYLID